MPRPFTVGWFTSYLVPDWTGPWAGDAGREWIDGTFAIETVRELERAGVDLVMLEDISYLADIVGGTFEAELRTNSRAPKSDPLPLVARLAAETSTIGLIATASSTFYPPELLARKYATLDHLSGGRAGWNVVTSTGDRAAQNFGMDVLPPHAERYARAQEYLETVHALWGSSTPPVGDRPVICQAGASPAGTALAGRFADVVVAAPHGVAAMRAYRERVRAAAVAAGRSADDVQVLFMVTPLLAETDDLAQQYAERFYAPTDAALWRRIVQLSGDIDYSAFDLDAPLPESTSTEGSRSILDNLRAMAAGRTLREVLSTQRTESVRLVGTAATVADRMGEVLDEVGGDGFLLFGGGGGVLTRRYVREVCDGLMPELRRRGLAGDPGPVRGLRERLSRRRSDADVLEVAP
ncbi:LLM class flavin-dependent oxidoreductase [Kineococcus rhizosphaerae]|uniref:Alkanesulfonate monooxygenase SsuD/methylene tetrahydromethanopterin reductase-like flavin-dependent oxidoreductase (Luciferase family) n=1 Tax=Kineococcus rhizosphaerae TaxID=559628 RepID=A0A2T0QYB1_9ACTN|nr:LLM class flavin-dependent oxidoreductase [Kineococcus rhizosphaerae]PRY11189.1 alkanesulfonate monooxygenase SsuD/methylene tetrahydromethanopterin reductase-like flavin-dependent oxidoreductase (luciferase family) [Kineococcus rhizosphaerae]